MTDDDHVTTGADLPRATAFIDGQNLFHCVQESFGYEYPNYDVSKLAQAICDQQGWRLTECRFYTGLHLPKRNRKWYDFWVRKFAQMGRQGVTLTRRDLRYQKVETKTSGGTPVVSYVGHEKGIDIRIALDVIRLTRANFLDVVLIFSQDQDFSELPDEVKIIATEQKRRVLVASSYPSAPGYLNTKGIRSTKWIPFEQDLYDKCIDPRDYRQP